MPKFCPTCGNQLQFENAEICPTCGVRIQPPPQTPKDIRNPWIAVLLCFLFPGWGQWYNGETWDGLAYFGAFWSCYILIRIFSIISSNTSFSFAYILVLILFIALIGFWIAGMYDAYKTVEKINRGELEFSEKSGLFWLPVVLLTFAVLVFIALIIVTAFFGMAGSTYNAPVYSPVSTPIPYSTSIIYQSPIPTIVPTPSVTIPKRVEDLNEQNHCQVLITCGKEITGGGCSDDAMCILDGFSNSNPVCQKAAWMSQYIKNCIKSNPYEAAGSSALECLHCMQGVGDLETCLKIASKCGISRDSMKSMYCRTSSC